MRAGTYVLLITSPISAGLNYLFIHSLKLGLMGAPIATGISYWLSFILLVCYSRYVDGWQCWGGWTWRCLHNWKTFSRIAILGILHVGSEWWAFEIITLAAARLGTVSLAAQSVISTSDQLMTTIPFGIGVATSSRVGNLLGAKDAAGARRAVNTATCISVLSGALVMIVLLAAKENFARIFNNDEEVVRMTASVLPLVAIFQIGDGLSQSCGGSLRGMGRQHIGAATNIVSYYGGALPLGIWLAFSGGWGLKGLWLGNCLALWMSGLLQWAVVMLSDFEKQVRNSYARMEKGEDTKLQGLETKAVEYEKEAERVQEKDGGYATETEREQAKDGGRI